MTALRTRTCDRSYGTRVFAACARGDVSISKLSPFCCGQTKVMQKAAATANSTRRGLSQRFMKLGSFGANGRECKSVAGAPGSLHALFWSPRCGPAVCPDVPRQLPPRERGVSIRAGGWFVAQMTTNPESRMFIPRVPSGVIPEPVVELCRHIEQGGFRAWVVGGSLRDVLMGRTPK